MSVNENFVLRKVYGKALLMPVRKNTLGDNPIFLNSVACQIWEYAAEHLTLDQIVSNLREMYSLEEDSAEEISVKNFIAELIDLGLVLND